MAGSPPIPRIGADEALHLLTEADLVDLGRRAGAVCRRLHPEPYRTFAIDRNVNFSNLCECRCRFCAFWRAEGDPEAYVLSEAAIAAKIEEAVRLGATHVLGQGGLSPRTDLDYYEGLLARIRARFPGVRLHCFSPPEVHDMARRAGLGYTEVLERLRAAGLDSLPGGGAEILVDRVRRRISPRKCTTGEWLGVMRAAHALGMPTSATMVFGHVETPAERIAHLVRVRELQDETGGFLSFIAWPFQAPHTALAETGGLPEGWRPVSGAAYLRTVAVARLVLDNVPNVQASWVTMGPKIGQTALLFGANDLGSTMIEENVVAAAGCRHRASPALLRRLIEAAGFAARQRDSRYQTVGA
ncbi:MAG: cyclic dehypoxanthinyl futalosine synthase [Phycisphaerae bacterium]